MQRLLLHFEKYRIIFDRLCVHVYISKCIRIYLHKCIHISCTLTIQIKSPIFKIQISSHLSQFSFSLQHILQLNIQNFNYQPLFTVFILQHLSNKLPFEIYLFSILIVIALSTLCQSFITHQPLTSRALYTHLTHWDGNLSCRSIRKMAVTVIGSDVPWLECPACNALTWVITLTE